MTSGSAQLWPLGAVQLPLPVCDDESTGLEGRSILHRLAFMGTALGITMTRTLGRIIDVKRAPRFTRPKFPLAHRLLSRKFSAGFQMATGVIS